jgi:aspartate/methionine/tyrosine aminotransferase
MALWLLHAHFFACLQVEMAGGTVVPLALKPKASGAVTSADWSLDETELRNAFSSRTKAIVINTPHNPTGKMFSKDELTLIGQLAKEHDALVLADEV